MHREVDVTKWWWLVPFAIAPVIAAIAAALTWM
jgi:hypothetical protein